MTYSKLLDIWLEEKSLEVRSSTKWNYKCTIESKLKPAFGSYEIQKITKAMIQNYILDISEHFKKESVINITKVLSQSFKFAVREKFIAENPYVQIKIPKDHDVKEIKIFTKDEMDAILNVQGFNPQYKNIISIAYRTGMRIGEILALKWEDVNLAQGFLMVRRTVSYCEKSKKEICPPKTRASIRRIDLDNTSIEILLSAKKYGEFVFSKKDGTIFSRCCISQGFQRICKAANVPYKSFHALRHTHASILLASNVHPKIVQERLGHSEISTTIDTYSHLIPGMQKIAVDIFNDL